MRGNGKTYDGRYYVSRVNHSVTFDRGEAAHRQGFTLIRRRS